MNTRGLDAGGARPDAPFPLGDNGGDPAALAWFQRRFDDLRAALSDRLLGHEGVVRDALTCLLAQGHLLIEGLPGLGKTVLAKALGEAISGSGSRIQFTPDLLPSDITGSQVWLPAHGGRFDFRPGPVFSNVVLADEINRASPKTHSALLEVMEERQVTVGGRTYGVPEPFFVIATQNPEELQGTFRLPEAQVDRFAMKLDIGYPGIDAERRMVAGDRRSVRGGAGADGAGSAGRSAVATPAEVRQMIETAAHEVRPHRRIVDFCVELAMATRRIDGAAAPSADLRDMLERTQPVRDALDVGVSPRATLALLAASRVRAASEGRDHVTPEDVRTLVPAVFGHRLVLAPSARGQGVKARTVAELLRETMPVPETPSGGWKTV